MVANELIIDARLVAYSVISKELSSAFSWTIMVAPLPIFVLKNWLFVVTYPLAETMVIFSILAI